MNEQRKKSIVVWTLIYIVIAGFMLTVLLAGCSPKVVERIVTETKVEYRDRIIHDTTTFEVPVEVEKIVTRDTASHLSNRWAKSDASVSGGLLSHSLESIPQVVKVPYEVEVHDTLYVQSEAKETIRTEKVEKPLSWWQRTRLALFPWVALLCIGLTIYIFRGIIKKFI